MIYGDGEALRDGACRVPQGLDKLDREFNASSADCRDGSAGWLALDEFLAIKGVDDCALQSRYAGYGTCIDAQRRKALRRSRHQSVRICVGFASRFFMSAPSVDTFAADEESIELIRRRSTLFPHTTWPRRSRRGRSVSIVWRQPHASIGRRAEIAATELDILIYRTSEWMRARFARRVASRSPPVRGIAIGDDGTSDDRRLFTCETWSRRLTRITRKQDQLPGSARHTSAIPGDADRQQFGLPGDAPLPLCPVAVGDPPG
jgi:hypothetical protein